MLMVRDPKLPPSLYEMILEKMFVEVESMLSESSREKEKKHSYIREYAKSAQDATDLYLNTLRAWGTTSSIRERIKLHKLYYKQRQRLTCPAEKVFDPMLKQAEIDLHIRMNQTAAGYLQNSPDPLLSDLNSHGSGSDTHALKSSIDEPSGITSDALFDMMAVSSHLSSRLSSSIGKERSAVQDKSKKTAIEKKTNANATVIEAMAEIKFMQGHYDEALKLFLAIGAQFIDIPLSSVEDEALRLVGSNALHEKAEMDEKKHQDVIEMSSPHRYKHVLAMVESHHMHRSILNEDRIELMLFKENDISFEESDNMEGANCSPVIAFIRLVGLDLSGRFLVENCVPPPGIGGALLEGTLKTDERSTSVHSERGANLPLDMVANQLRSSPKLLHWYLHQIFVHKPEIYVRFSNTAVPPKEITDLHRIHLESYIEYAYEDTSDDERDLSDVPAYDAADVETPLMAFLKAALHYGGARPDDVRRMLEERRRKSTGSSLFARELAFVIKTYGSDTEEDSRKILELYLEGAKSLPIAVEYAEQNSKHSAVLWEMLVARCIQSGGDGSLFGALLEAAARCGADLAHLVSQIPEGMRIEGLRPRLIAAVADYRLKLKIHESASDVLSQDKVGLLRELCHRSRRGLRVVSHVEENKKAGQISISTNISNTESRRVYTEFNAMAKRRSKRHRHALSMPIR